MKVDKILLIDQIKSIQLDGKILDCAFNGYPIGMKGYDSLKVESGGSKFINCTCITFSKFR